MLPSDPERATPTLQGALAEAASGALSCPFGGAETEHRRRGRAVRGLAQALPRTPCVITSGRPALSGPLRATDKMRGCSVPPSSHPQGTSTPLAAQSALCSDRTQRRVRPDLFAGDGWWLSLLPARPGLFDIEGHKLVWSGAPAHGTEPPPHTSLFSGAGADRKGRSDQARKALACGLALGK